MASQQYPNYVYVRSGDLEVTPYNRRCAKTLGWWQIVAGCSCVILEVAYMLMADSGCRFAVYAGMWTGVFHVFAGVVGVMSARRASKCRVVSFMVLSILSSCLATVGLLIAIAAMAFIMNKADRAEAGDVMEPTSTCYYVSERESFIPQAGLIFVQFVEAIVAITSASVCCRGVCCGRTTLPTTTTTTTTTTAAAPMQASGAAGPAAPGAPVNAAHGYYFPAAYPPQGGPAVPSQPGYPAPQSAPYPAVPHGPSQPGYPAPQAAPYPAVPPGPSQPGYPAAQGASYPAASAGPYQPGYPAAQGVPYPAVPAGPSQPGYPESKGGLMPSAPAPPEDQGATVLPSYEEAISQKPA